MLTKMVIGKKSDAHDSNKSPRFASRLKKFKICCILACTDIDSNSQEDLLINMAKNTQYHDKDLFNL